MFEYYKNYRGETWKVTSNLNDCRAFWTTQTTLEMEYNWPDCIKQIGKRLFLQLNNAHLLLKYWTNSISQCFNGHVLNTLVIFENCLGAQVHVVSVILHPEVISIDYIISEKSSKSRMRHGLTKTHLTVLWYQGPTKKSILKWLTDFHIPRELVEHK